MKPRCVAWLFLLALHAGAHAADTCTFAPPAPLLQPHAYPGQTEVRGGANKLQEDAQLGAGLHLEIRQGGCVDVLTTEYVLTLPDSGRDHAGEDALIALARTEIGRLKTRRTPAERGALLDFLKRAPTLPPRDGSRTLCRDGGVPETGECSWNSQGGYSVSVTRNAHATRVRVTEMVSG